MHQGFKVFDADAHVVEPRDLWDRFLDTPFRHRVGWRQPFPGMDRFRPATVDGRYTQSLATLYGNQQEAVRWTTEAMIAKYGDRFQAQDMQSVQSLPSGIMGPVKLVSR